MLIKCNRCNMIPVQQNVDGDRRFCGICGEELKKSMAHQAVLDDVRAVAWNIDDNFIYSLKHYGWEKGKEIFENDITIDIKCHRGSDESKKLKDQISKLIYNFLTGKD